MSGPFDNNQPWWQRLLWIGLPLLLIVGVLSLVLNRQNNDTSEVNIEGVEWQLSELLLDDALGSAVAGSGATLLLDAGTASGSGGCNSFSGTYDLDGASLTFSPLASTLLICDDPPGTADQEYVYLALLGEVDEYAVVDDRLTLITNGTTVLVFSAD